MNTMTHQIAVSQTQEFDQLRKQVAVRASAEGRTDSLYDGLRFYKFSQSIHYQKKQMLMPGIVVVLQGRKMALLQRETLTYDESNYLILGTETLCQGTVVTASENEPYLAIHLDLPINILVKAIANLVNQMPPTATKKIADNFTQSIDPNLINALGRLLAATDSLPDRQTIAPLIIEEIIVRLLRSDAGARIRDLAVISRSAMRIQDSIRFMQEQLHRPLSIADLAEQAAMSTSHYAHHFREVAGVTPMRYLRDLRLEKARNLLLYRGMRPNEAAYNSGFESIEHFNREFKRRYANTPTQYLVELRKISQF
ncbi:transcriptional regulator [Cellvibrio zantedeschiae]|uniref:Transcriptional regulator n=1 Tax=Cellvibrio zantedeschiae TaxID=1237077 RepID=A0ABQ3AQ59_9GAMM|nr:AraC family transcriptional regulator [Cellvibrio zantedeschiae]GGY64367.1 transcriptional regulator [Cellvibrio zantedeschiae]